MTKILFLALWYCSIYPCALFLCSFALLVNFFTDRFSLMRTWKRAPMLGNTISRFSRKYFFSAAIVAQAIVSSYYWSGFPYDNLCSEYTTARAVIVVVCSRFESHVVTHSTRLPRTQAMTTSSSTPSIMVILQLKRLDRKRPTM